MAKKGSKGRREGRKEGREGERKEGRAGEREGGRKMAKKGSKGGEKEGRKEGREGGREGRRKEGRKEGNVINWTSPCKIKYYSWITYEDALKTLRNPPSQSSSLSSSTLRHTSLSSSPLLPYLQLRELIDNEFTTYIDIISAVEPPLSPFPENHHGKPYNDKKEAQVGCKAR